MKWLFAIFSIVLLTGISRPSRACTPDCTDKECGDDGCGGSCGTCQSPAKCVVGHCVKGCGGLVAPGLVYGSCCYKGKMVECTADYGGEWVVKDCGGDENCRWEPVAGEYLCDPTLPDYEDPTHRQPRECDFNCVPYCKNRNCGDDGCGGSCGTCPTGDKCLDGQCCHPNCEGKDCGPDGCGGECGHCHDWEFCTDSGQCKRNWGCREKLSPGCPDCACMEEVCKESPGCCRWNWDFFCAIKCKETGKCGPCVPDCKGKECGSDGCGGQCGQCPKGDTCVKGKCMTCYPDCKGKECGDDGCGGSCGKCPDKYVCKNGMCEPCKPGCAIETSCGTDECGNPCWQPGELPCTPPGEVCRDNTCIPCEPYCVNRECGSDECDGSCGKCGPCEQCISHHCKPIPDCEAPEPMPDTAEDVHVGKDVHIAEEVNAGRDVAENTDPGQAHTDTGQTDSGKPGKDVRNDHKVVKDTSKDITGHPDSARDRHAVDAVGPDTNTKSSGGGCSTGPGPASGIWLIFLGLLALLLRRRQGQ